MKIMTTTAIVSLLAAPALAGGLETPQPDMVIQPAPVIAQAYSGADWTGGYVGAQLSYGDISNHGDSDGDTVDDSLMSANGALGGLRAGYLYDLGTWVVGAELALNASGVDFDAGNGSLDELHQFKLKGGYDMGRTLVYGTLGAAHAKGDFQGNDFSETGYLVGVGLDYMATDNISVGGEVTYNRFNDVINNGNDIGVTTVGANVAYHF